MKLKAQEVNVSHVHQNIPFECVWGSKHPHFVMWMEAPGCFQDFWFHLSFSFGAECARSLCGLKMYNKTLVFQLVFLECIVSQTCLFLQHGFGVVLSLGLWSYGHQGIFHWTGGVPPLLKYTLMVTHRLQCISIFHLSFRRCSVYVHWWQLQPSFGWYWSPCGFHAGRWNKLSFSGSFFMSQMERNALTASLFLTSVPWHGEGWEFGHIFPMWHTVFVCGSAEWVGLADPPPRHRYK